MGKWAEHQLFTSKTPKKCPKRPFLPVFYPFLPHFHEISVPTFIRQKWAKVGKSGQKWPFFTQFHHPFFIKPKTKVGKWPNLKTKVGVNLEQKRRGYAFCTTSRPYIYIRLMLRSFAHSRKLSTLKKPPALAAAPI